MLSLLHTRDTINKERQENENFSNSRYNFQDKKDVQPKNVNMTWEYRKFPRHPVATEKL